MNRIKYRFVLQDFKMYKDLCLLSRYSVIITLIGCFDKCYLYDVDLVFKRLIENSSFREIERQLLFIGSHFIAKHHNAQQNRKRNEASDSFNIFSLAIGSYIL